MAISKVSVLVILAAAAGYMASADSVVKRSDDSNPLQAVVSTLSMELSQMKSRTEALETRTRALEDLLDKRVAFTASLKAVVVANAPIKFYQGFNLGGGYDPLTGVYTVPISGVYSFHFQLFPQVFADFVIDLFLNGAIVIRSRCYDSASYPTSCSSSSVFHVLKGDKIWLQSSLEGTYFPDLHSFFSGVLVSPDP